MKGKLGIFAAMCCALALAFALVGCSSGGTQAVDKSKYTGDWTLSYGSDENLDADSLELMKSLGLEVKLTLNEDGTGSLDLFGDESSATWEASSNTEGKITIEGTGEATMQLADSELTISDQSGESMTFAR